MKYSGAALHVCTSGDKRPPGSGSVSASGYSEQENKACVVTKGAVCASGWNISRRRGGTLERLYCRVVSGATYRPAILVVVLEQGGDSSRIRPRQPPAHFPVSLQPRLILRKATYWHRRSLLA